MKNIRKIITILIVLFIILAIFCNNIYAFSISDFTGTATNNGELNNIGNKTITIISTIGSIISVIVLIIIGIKYMLGSVEEKATYKRTLMPYVIGATLVFAASSIAGIIYSMVIGKS